VRPTADRVREAWMSALGGRLDGITVLDLFAGSGALGLEALSRGAAHATFVEIARAGFKSLAYNVRLLEAGGQTTVVKADALKYVRTLEVGAFDLVLADPPYGKGHAAALLRYFSDVPFARELWVEHRTGERLPEQRGLRHRRYGDTTLTTASVEVDGDNPPTREQA